jgi:transposase-like protein
MCQSIGKISNGRFHTDRFQKQVLKKISSVPANLNCPECHHGYDIAISRKQVIGSLWSRHMVRHYRCGVCDHRFSRWNAEPAQKFMRIALVAAAFLAMILLPDWLL